MTPFLPLLLRHLYVPSSIVAHPRLQGASQEDGPRGMTEWTSFDRYLNVVFYRHRRGAAGRRRGVGLLRVAD